MADELTQLDRIEAALESQAADIAGVRSLVQRVLTREIQMANQIDQLRDDFRTNTDAVAARIDTILAQLNSTADNTASDATLADLKVISDHLRALGTSQTQPVPALPPAPTV